MRAHGAAKNFRLPKPHISFPSATFSFPRVAAGLRQPHLRQPAVAPSSPADPRPDEDSESTAGKPHADLGNAAGRMPRPETTSVKSRVQPPRLSEQNKQADDYDAAAAPPIMLRDLQRKMLEIITSGGNDNETLDKFMRLLRGITGAAGLICFQRGVDGQLVAGPRLRRKWLVFDDRLIKRLTAWCHKTCAENQVCVETIDRANELFAVTLPVATGDGETESLCVILDKPASLNYCIAILQLAAAYLGMWHLRGESAKAEWQAASAAALVEMVSRLQSCDRLQLACYRLVKDMRDFLGCQRVAIGLRPRNTRRCRLHAISGLAEFDRRADIVRMLEAVMEEAILRDEFTVWPVPTSRRHATLAHKKLARIAEVETVASSPLKDDHDEVIGAWVFLGGTSWSQDTKHHLAIQAAAPHVGSCLQSVRRNQRGRLSRILHKFWRERRSCRMRIAVGVLVALGALMLLPLPYRISCDVKLQPVTRRFVAAPFAGILKETTCEPGERVVANQTLARLDGREIRWELAGLLAEHGRASKERRVALATHDTATAQLAELRMQRLALRIRLLEHRNENVDIKSPIDGLVIRGDLKNSVGVPVTTGQSLFEVAPLDRMLAEIAIPDEQIDFVKPGYCVQLRLGADLARKHESRLSHIHPAAEVIDGENVFVGEVVVDNSDDALRPGMVGRATIVGPREPLFWILFHKPWHFLIQTLGG